MSSSSDISKNPGASRSRQPAPKYNKVMSTSTINDPFIHWFAFKFQVKWESMHRYTELIDLLQKKLSPSNSNTDKEIQVIGISGKEHSFTVESKESLEKQGYKKSALRVSTDSGVRLLFTESAQGKTVYNISVVFPGSVLERASIYCLLDKTLNIISDLGGKITNSMLSRVDVTVDVLNVPISAFAAKFEDGHFISRYRHMTKYHGEHNNIQTIYYGSSFPDHTQGNQKRKKPSLLFVFYDKLQEMEKYPKRRQYLAETQWGGDPVAVTRIEIRMHQPFLAARGVHTPQDFFMGHRALLASATRTSFRFTDRNPDRENNNQSKTKMWPIWHQIADKFDCLDLKSCRGVITDAPPRTQTNQHRINIIIGQIKSYAKLSNIPVKTHSEMSAFFNEKVLDIYYDWL